MQIANVEMAKAWDGHDGDHWTDYADRYDRAGRFQWARFREAVPVGVADHVLDVGCGSGHAARDVARLVGDGSVLGVDLSSRMLELARKRGADDGLTNVEFVQADAQVHPFEPASFDLAISSFGMMFFGDPVAAFANVGGSLRSGGRLALMAWRELASNAWIMSIREALDLGRGLPLPPPDAPPPPFSLGDPAHVQDLLTSAGYTDVELAPMDLPMDMGSDADDAFAFFCTLGIVEGLSDGLDDERRAQALDNLREVARAHETPEGVLVDSAAWLITATRP